MRGGHERGARDRLPFDMALSEMALRLALGDVDEAAKLVALWRYRPQIARHVAAENGWRVYFPEGGES